MDLTRFTQHAALKAQRNHPKHGKPAAAAPQPSISFDDQRFAVAVRDANGVSTKLLGQLKARCGN